MTVETDIQAALQSVAPGRVWPNRRPQDTGDALYIVFQWVGGIPVDFVESVLPDKRNGRLQVAVWGQNFAAVATAARTVEQLLVESTTLRAGRATGQVGDHDPVTNLHGVRQDFSIWF